MRWRSAGGVRWLEVDLPGAGAAFSTRTAGSAREDPERHAAALGIDAGQVTTLRQVHGAELARGAAAGSTAADGLVIDEPGQVGLVFVADCLPVAVAGPGGVAILHCGWRGLAAGIVARGASAVDATHAAIGPGIGPCCYEVGEEVLATFSALGEGVASGARLDLACVARELLASAGVERIECADLCTRCESDLFFSYRREADRAGRQAGLAWVEPQGGRTWSA